MGVYYMKYYMEYCNVEEIRDFYNDVIPGFTKFTKITPERQEALDKLAYFYAGFFRQKTQNIKTIMYKAVVEITRNKDKLGLQNSDEILYFYIRTADPNMEFYKLSLMYPEKEERIEHFKEYFLIYDGKLIALETMCFNRFMKNTQEETNGIKK